MYPYCTCRYCQPPVRSRYRYNRRHNPRHRLQRRKRVRSGAELSQRQIAKLKVEFLETGSVANAVRETGISDYRARKYLGDLIQQYRLINEDMLPPLVQRIYQETNCSLTKTVSQLRAWGFGASHKRIKKWIEDIVCVDPRIAEARRIYQETNCNQIETLRQLQAMGLGVGDVKIKEWIEDIQCGGVDPRIAEAQRIYQETNCNKAETLRQLRKQGMRIGNQKIDEWIEDIQCEGARRSIRSPNKVYPEFQIAEARRIYLETGCRLNETTRQLRKMGMGAANETVKEWVEDIQCIEDVDPRIAEAQRIYQETGCNMTETMRQLREMGMSTSRKTFKKWVEDIQCVDIDPRIAEAQRIYQETNCNMKKTIRQLRKIGMGAGGPKIEKWVEDIKCDDIDPRIAEAQRIYRETGYNMSETMRQLRELGMGVAPKTIKGWVAHIIDPRIAEAQRIYIETNCNLSQTRRLLQAIGMNAARPTIKKWVEDISCIIPEKTDYQHWYNQGLTDREIADVLNKNITSVRKWRQKQKPPLLSNSKLPNYRYWYDQGLTDLEIAAKVNRSGNRVGTWRRSQKPSLPPNKPLQPLQPFENEALSVIVQKNNHAKIIDFIPALGNILGTVRGRLQRLTKAGVINKVPRGRLTYYTLPDSAKNNRRNPRPRRKLQRREGVASSCIEEHCLHSRYRMAFEFLQNNNASIAFAAKHFGIAHNSLWGHLNDYHKTYHSHVLKKRNEQIAHAQKLCRTTNLSRKKIGEQLGGVSGSTITGWCKGIKRPKKERPVEQAQELYRNTNLTFTEIGEQLGFSRDIISRWCKGVERPKKPIEKARKLCQTTNLFYREIGEQLGVTGSTIAGWCDGVKRPEKPERPIKQARELCRTTYLSYREIGELLGGVHKAAIRYWCRGVSRPLKPRLPGTAICLGYKVPEHDAVAIFAKKLCNACYKRKRREMPKQIRLDFKKWYDQGLSDREIADIVGKPRTAVTNWRFRHKLSPNRRKKEPKSSYRRNPRPRRKLQRYEDASSKGGWTRQQQAKLITDFWETGAVTYAAREAGINYKLATKYIGSDEIQKFRFAMKLLECSKERCYDPKYAHAIETYKNKKISIAALERNLSIPVNSLRGHMLTYHKQLLSKKTCVTSKCIHNKYKGAITFYKKHDMSIRKVAKKFDLKYPNLRRHLMSYHTHIKPKQNEKKAQCNNPKYKDIVEYLKQNRDAPLRVTATMFNVSRNSLRHHLKTYHSQLIRTGIGRPTNYQHWYDQGLTDPEIADKVNRTIQSVLRWRRNQKPPLSPNRNTRPSLQKLL